MGRRVVSLLLGVTALGAATGALAARPDEPKVTAQAAVVMDARTGELLWSRNPDQQRAPASTTKILTTVLALESGRLDEVVRVSSQAQAQVPSKLYLRAGQTAKLRDLLYALMLKSANDAAVVVAEGVSGSVPKFAERMNEWARAAGARSSNFRNPSGLPDAAHVSTARDLGLILRRAVHVPGFLQVAGTTGQRIPITTGKKQQWMVLKTKNRLLQGYSVPVIGKTGFTRAAGRCFAGYAERNGRSLIVVVLGAADMWGDTRKLFDWAFKQEDRDVPLPVQVQVAARAPGSVLPSWRSESPRPRPAGQQRREVSPPEPAAGVVQVALSPSEPAAKPAPVIAPVARPAVSPERPRAAKPPAKEPAPVAKPRPATRENPGRVTLAMGTGSSTRNGTTYYDEYPSQRGMIRRGCTGSGCGRVGESRR